MQKLTPSQSTLLSYFAKGGHVEICTTVCSQLGTTNFPPNKPEQFSKTVLYSLIKESLLRTTGEQLVFGIRWSRLQITERGLSRHEDVETQHAPV